MINLNETQFLFDTTMNFSAKTLQLVQARQQMYAMSSAYVENIFKWKDFINKEVVTTQTICLVSSLTKRQNLVGAGSGQTC